MQKLIENINNMDKNFELTYIEHCTEYIAFSNIEKALMENNYMLVLSLNKLQKLQYIL